MGTGDIYLARSVSLIGELKWFFLEPSRPLPAAESKVPSKLDDICNRLEVAEREWKVLHNMRVDDQKEIRNLNKMIRALNVNGHITIRRSGASGEKGLATTRRSRISGVKGSRPPADQGPQAQKSR